MSRCAGSRPRWSGAGTRAGYGRLRVFLRFHNQAGDKPARATFHEGRRGVLQFAAPSRTAACAPRRVSAREGWGWLSPAPGYHSTPQPWLVEAPGFPGAWASRPARGQVGLTLDQQASSWLRKVSSSATAFNSSFMRVSSASSAAASMASNRVWIAMPVASQASDR